VNREAAVLLIIVLGESATYLAFSTCLRAQKSPRDFVRLLVPLQLGSMVLALLMSGVSLVFSVLAGSALGGMGSLALYGHYTARVGTWRDP